MPVLPCVDYTYINLPCGPRFPSPKRLQCRKHQRLSRPSTKKLALHQQVLHEQRPIEQEIGGSLVREKQHV